MYFSKKKKENVLFVLIWFEETSCDSSFNTQLQISFYLYRYVHGPKNDLQYWGLDYPPLTAYHMMAAGMMLVVLNLHCHLLT